MRHEIQCEIYCGVECVIVRGTGSTASAEDRRSPEASWGTELSWHRNVCIWQRRRSRAFGRQQRADSGGHAPQQRSPGWVGPGHPPHPKWKRRLKTLLHPRVCHCFFAGGSSHRSQTAGQDSRLRLPGVRPLRDAAGAAAVALRLCRLETDSAWVWGRMGSFAIWL